MADLPVPVREAREGWGMATRAVSHVVWPTSAADVLAAYAMARAAGWSVAAWGNGRSYGDAALNDGNLLLDFSRMDRVLEWDAITGRVVCEPGVTLFKLWQHTLPDGWWPPVVTGTMYTTVGGITAANAHGKNNFAHGPMGEHVVAFTLVTPDGQVREVTRESHPDLFHAAIGGFGWLGHFTSITIQMKRVYSGRIEVHPSGHPDLESMFSTFERLNEARRDYVVGWIDAFAGGSGLGRGQIHAARYLQEGEDPEGREWLALDRQEQPTRMFGVIPKGWAWWLARPFRHRLGMRLINAGRYAWMFRPGGHAGPILESHAGFNFLLDFVPDWKRFYQPGGLIQYQFFLPRARARDTFREALRLAQDVRQEPWLVVMKRHRPDAFWLSHALDGYSFACDFRVTDASRGQIWRLTERYNQLVTDVGGRFYFAKDSVVDGESVRRSLGDDVLGRFFALKASVDPHDLLGGSQFRRIFGPIRARIPLPVERAGSL